MSCCYLLLAFLILCFFMNDFFNLMRLTFITKHTGTYSENFRVNVSSLHAVGSTVLKRTPESRKNLSPHVSVLRLFS